MKRFLLFALIGTIQIKENDEGRLDINIYGNVKINGKTPLTG